MTKKWYVLLMVAILLISAATIGAADEPPKKVAKLMKKAEKALTKQDLEKALESYNKAKELAPEYGPIYMGFANIQLAQKKYDEAVPNLLKAAELANDNAPLKNQVVDKMVRLAKQALQKRDIKKANDYFLKIIAIPDIESLDNALYSDILFQIANNYSLLRKYDKSNEYFLKVLEIPNLDTTNEKLSFQVKYKLGLNFYNLKKFKDSNVYFEKLVAMPNAKTIDPKFYATTHYLIGLNASQAGDYPKSTKFLKKFLELNTDETVKNAQLDPLAHFIVGTNLMSDLDNEVQKIRDAKPKDMKEQIKKLAADNAEIADHLNAAIAGKPELEPAYMHLGNFYYYSGNKEKAIEFYKTLIEKFPLSPDVEAYKQFLSDLENSDKNTKKK